MANIVLFTIVCLLPKSTTMLFPQSTYNHRIPPPPNPLSRYKSPFLPSLSSLLGRFYIFLCSDHLHPNMSFFDDDHDSETFPCNIPLNQTFRGRAFHPFDYCSYTPNPNPTFYRSPSSTSWDPEPAAPSWGRRRHWRDYSASPSHCYPTEYSPRTRYGRIRTGRRRRYSDGDDDCEREGYGYGCRGWGYSSPYPNPYTTDPGTYTDWGAPRMPKRYRYPYRRGQRGVRFPWSWYAFRGSEQGWRERAGEQRAADGDESDEEGKEEDVGAEYEVEEPGTEVDGDGGQRSSDATPGRKKKAFASPSRSSESGPQVHYILSPPGLDLETTQGSFTQDEESREHVHDTDDEDFPARASSWSTNTSFSEPDGTFCDQPPGWKESGKAKKSIRERRRVLRERRKILEEEERELMERRRVLDEEERELWKEKTQLNKWRKTLLLQGRSLWTPSNDHDDDKGMKERWETYIRRQNKFRRSDWGGE